MKKGWFESHAEGERLRALDVEGARQSKSRGTRVADRYVLGRSVGRGGMATVYLATDTLLNRPVALKMLRHELAHSAAMDRFTREIGVVSHLRHAHIVPLHDSGIYEGLPFYVMAYVEGESLHERLKRARVLPPADVARIGAEVAEALAYAHREGVLHRDITPGNILLADGNAHLADFGIARVFQDTGRARTTASGFVLGTPTYISPEQASGELDYDGRSDIYSLGCVLYEACAGDPPFRGPTPQAVIAARFGPPPPRLDVVRRGVPTVLAAAIARAMSLAPEHRFTDAAELAAELRVAMAAAPPERQRSLGSRGARIAIVVALLAGVFFAAGYWAATR
jgi:serine/threonine protein kinase